MNTPEVQTVEVREVGFAPSSFVPAKFDFELIEDDPRERASTEFLNRISKSRDQRPR